MVLFYTIFCVTFDVANMLFFNQALFYTKIRYTIMKNQLYITFIGFMLFTIIQCSKTTPINNPTNVSCDSANTVLIPADMKARFYFKEGTYWVYKNIDNSEIDSMWVWDGENIISTVNPKWYTMGLNKCYESFSYLVKNKIFDGNNYYSGIGITIHPEDGLIRPNELFEITETSPLNNFRGDFRIQIRGNTYQTQTEAEILFEDSIITVDNIKFKDILNLKYPSITNDIYSNMYYAMNIGLVKFIRSNDNSTWELIRYNVNQ